ncbi:translational GTPase TypA [Dehalogenimonas etheniformans]|uniref:Large ribosomal subunit assembly factor BipA n=1 Tax=Dehalogenimonas etheniformans TaxID=1536648 RepID=A0A2P5P948_9CHLR|nr:translational GTPase TypA [Dehalogenimonas etheniformans]PPD58817.1 translational GTPase TypA [Dehalogenimonas etheniformans]QNT76414.1 translational GTPase TypA [Dehalogenimonas etheniformans]
MPQYRDDIRNVAIIAHVDHGKTSLVDILLKQSHVFRENQEMGECILDRNALEREKGITILAKNTAVEFRGHKLNIIDTPGHADFSGEVERVLNMAEGCLLLIDSTDGPMPQTRFVLKQAMEKKLKPIVVITKMDRPTRRIKEVLSMTQDLFLELATEDSQLDYPVIYSTSRGGYATTDPDVVGTDMVPLFEAIIKTVPPPEIEEGHLQLLVSNLDYSTHKGRIAIGRIRRGSICPRDPVVVIDKNGEQHRYNVNEVFTHMGLARQEVDKAEAGDIVAVTGMEEVNIGDTIASPEQPEALPGITIGEPTVKMTFGVNTSPFGGREGKYCTSRQLRARLYRELETNISLRVEDTDSPDVFLVSGRGELHLSILIETMRREGYELELSKPEAIFKNIGGKTMEPMEALIVDTVDDCIGDLTEMLAKRKGRMTNMHHDDNGNVRMEYHIPTRGLIGFRSSFLTTTRGRGVMNTLFLGYEPWQGEIGTTRSGVLIAAQPGIAVTYGLNNAQGRGLLFIEPMTDVYEGMIAGLHARGSDLVVNVCKEKKMTNIRSSTSDIAIKLTTPIKMSLEESLDFIEDDELVEVTPKNIRLRKKILSAHDRKRAGRAGPGEEADE